MNIMHGSHPTETIIHANVNCQFSFKINDFHIYRLIHEYTRQNTDNYRNIESVHENKTEDHVTYQLDDAVPCVSKKVVRFAHGTWKQWNTEYKCQGLKRNIYFLDVGET